jgi:phosphate:Na+ symporter
MQRTQAEQTSPLTRGLDPAALVSPIVAVEAVRRTVALAIETVCGSVGVALLGASNDGVPGLGKSGLTVAAAADALRQAQEFISDVSSPPDSKAEELRLTSTLHALDHASQLAKIAREESEFATMKGGSEDVRAGQLCAEAMQKAASVVGDIARESALSLGSDSRPPATVEAQSDGSRIVRAMVPILESPRHNAKSNEHHVCALAHSAIGR